MTLQAPAPSWTGKGSVPPTPQTSWTAVRGPWGRSLCLESCRQCCWWLGRCQPSCLFPACSACCQPALPRKGTKISLSESIHRLHVCDRNKSSFRWRSNFFPVDFHHSFPRSLGCYFPLLCISSVQTAFIMLYTSIDWEISVYKFNLYIGKR